MDTSTTTPFHLCTTNEAFESELAPYLGAFIDQPKQGRYANGTIRKYIVASGILNGGQASHTLTLKPWMNRSLANSWMGICLIAITRLPHVGATTTSVPPVGIFFAFFEPVGLLQGQWFPPAQLGMNWPVLTAICVMHKVLRPRRVAGGLVSCNAFCWHVSPTVKLPYRRCNPSMFANSSPTSWNNVVQLPTPVRWLRR